MMIDFTANESQSQQRTMQLVNVDDEQDESDEMMSKVVKSVLRVMVSKISLTIRVTIVTVSKMRMLYVRWGLSCVMFKVKVR